MRREDEHLLRYFRTKQCEKCGRTCGGAAQPHHVKPRGHGSGSRLDVAANLIALCWECHESLQEGGRKAQIECWTIIAAREGLSSWRVCEAAVHRLLRSPKR